MNKKQKTADTVFIGGEEILSLLDRKRDKAKPKKWVCFVSRFYKKTARSFVAVLYRSVNAVGNSCKATLWHTQHSA